MSKLDEKKLYFAFINNYCRCFYNDFNWDYL